MRRTSKLSLKTENEPDCLMAELTPIGSGSRFISSVFLREELSGDVRGNLTHSAKFPGSLVHLRFDYLELICLKIWHVQSEAA